MRPSILLPALLGPLLLLGGCDYLGIESAAAVAARKQAEGQAIGAGCRHAARSLEECFATNRRSDKAAIFAGWKEMDDYMRENNIEAVPPRTDPALAAAADIEREPADSAAEPGRSSGGNPRR